VNRVKVRFGEQIREIAVDTYVRGDDGLFGGAIGMSRHFARPVLPDIPGYRIVEHMPDKDGVCYSAIKEPS
jgi:hypothetical protein